MGWRVICLACGHAIAREQSVCNHCGRPVSRDPHDLQCVEFESVSDGYHSWYSQPTAYHHVYRCLSHPAMCGVCVHCGDTFCRSGRIDLRVVRREADGSVSLQWDKGTELFAKE